MAVDDKKQNNNGLTGVVTQEFKVMRDKKIVVHKVGSEYKAKDKQSFDILISKNRIKKSK